MRFSILTPTLNRPSLEACIESVKSQTFKDWEHIIEVDEPRINNFGNTPRHRAWTRATGDYVLYLDDDNFLAHPRALSDVDCFLMSCNDPDWAIFPILRHGHRFFNDPPGLCRTDTANMVIKREIGQWPDGPEYTMDGIFCEQLKKKYAYAAFPLCTPIVVMPASSEGK